MGREYRPEPDCQKNGDKKIRALLTTDEHGAEVRPPNTDLNRRTEPVRPTHAEKQRVERTVKKMEQKDNPYRRKRR
jgi:hypothetical protein